MLEQRGKKLPAALVVQKHVRMQIEEQEALRAAAGREIVDVQRRAEQVEQASLGKIVDRTEHRFRCNDAAVFVGAAQIRLEAHGFLVRQAERRLKNRPQFEILEPSGGPPGLLGEHAPDEVQRVHGYLNIHWRLIV